jgi:DNA helicase-2/ATP-dependent DNA helicase PcrA
VKIVKGELSMGAESKIFERILNSPSKLSADQKKAVLSDSRYTRIIAGAGAGKTETLTRRIAYLLLYKKVKPSEIVAFTFTEKAAQSMKSRVYQRVGEIAGADATKNLGEMYVGTIHAYAKRILEDYFRFGNHGVLDENQEIAFLMRHGWSLGINQYGNSYVDCCRNFLRTVNMVWGEMLDEKMLEKRAQEFFIKLKRYEDLLSEHRQLTFGRMIYQAVLKLREAQDTLSHVHHLLVDEYQDINQAQAELISLVGGNGSIFVVGDPRQSIYQWRGSDEKFFDIFEKMFPGTTTVTIRENRRSAKRIVQNANKFADSFERVHYEKMDPTRSDEGFIGIADHELPDDEAVWIADQVEDLVLQKKALRFSDIGVLTRSVSSSAGPLIDELKRRRIPYIVGGTVGLFKRDEAQAVGRIFSWFWEEGFWVPEQWKWNERINGDNMLTSALDCWDAAQPHGHPENAERRLREIKEDLSSDNSSYDNFTKIYQDVLIALGFERLNFENQNDAAVMANLGRFNNLLTDYESANRIGGRRPDWERDLRGLCWFMNTYALQAYEEQPSDDIRGVDAVQVMTIHQAKGLEWPIVFLFATVSRRFPPMRLGSEQNWCDVPRNMFDAARYEGDLEDERRLFYVAITRPRDVLVTSHFERINRSVSRSMFIEDMDLGNAARIDDGADLPDLAVNPSMVPEEIQTFSAGEIITYSICPHMYLLRDLWGYQPQLNMAIGFGNSLHHCLRQAGELIKKEGCNPPDAVRRSVEEGFHIPFVGGVVFDYFKNGAKNILIDFSKKYAEDLKRIEEVEYRLEYPIQNATIMGKVDVILREGGNMEVRDYKTSEEARTFEESSIQVRLYAAGLKSLGRPITSGSIAYLEEQEIKMVDTSDQLLSDSNRFAEKIVEGIVNGDFRPNAGQSCSRCDQSPICRWKIGL